MLRFICTLIIMACGFLASNAQEVNFSPELTMGNRSTAYQHFIGYRFNNKWSVNNISMFDTEYGNDNNNISFIRTTLSYKFNNHFKANVALGVKNPGAFVTLTSQYGYRSSRFKLSYALGSTYQNGFTLEQSLMVNYTPSLSKNLQAYLNLFAVANTNLKVLDRGIQQLRFGIIKEHLITGIAFNLDQFTNAKKTLENFGIFIKHNF